MSANFYQLLKYAKTGIAAQDMTAYDKMRAIAMAGAKYPIQTITGVPPIRFRSDGSPLDNVTIIGNSQQTGTPTPDNIIIMPDFCGVKTGNWFDVSAIEKGRIDNGEVGYASYTSSLTIEGGTVYFTTTANYRGVCSGFFEIPDGTETITFNFTRNEAIGVKFVFYDSAKTWLNQDYTPYLSDIPPATANVPSGAKYVRLSFTGQKSGGYSYTMSNIMLNDGSTALQYEPYGYKLTITSANQTVPVYLGQVQTFRRVKKLMLTGGEEFIRSGSGDNVYYQLILSDSARTDSLDSSLCTHFTYATISSSNTDIGFFILSNGSSIRIRPSDVSSSTLQTFTDWLAQQYAAGTPVTIWYALAAPEIGIVNEPLSKIGDYADELHSADAGITIQTVRGNNTLTVDTDLQPSSVTITGHIKPV